MQGETLGTYLIESELGSGGMGAVYLARADGERVALKVLHPQLLLAPDARDRFALEVRLGRKVQHPNVVRTLDAGEQDGKHYLVMEFVEGQTLRALGEELGRVPERLCRHVGVEVARGLAAIHAVGAVHRDLKPDNVLITPDQSIKIMDLGVARLLDDVDRMSKPGQFVGSLLYAAPEQLRLGGKDTDGRSDLHALGLVLYEMATGEHPFHADTTRAVLMRLLNETPRAAGEVNPQLSPFFEEVLRALLEKEPESRFETAGVLAEVLEEGEASAWWRERERSIRHATRQPLRRIRIPRETALYGREEELARLGALYRSAGAGYGRVALVEGEAGIGKTRLIDEFVAGLRRAGEEVSFLFGANLPAGAATSVGAFSSALREHFGSEALERQLEGLLADTPILVPAFAAMLRGEPSPEAEEPLTQESLQNLFARTVRALAGEHPVVLLIEDLHFSPEEGRTLFMALAAALTDARVLLIGTARPGLPDSWVAELQHTADVTVVPTERLGQADVQRLLADAFRSPALAKDLAPRVASRSEGNPFFVFELIEGLRESPLLARADDGSWSRTDTIRTIEVPSSLRELIEGRLAGLPEEERDLLEVAACWGHEFDPVLVGDALDAGAVATLKRFGRIEKARRLIRQAGRGYVFDHHLIQEALYESQLAPLRERYHGMLAAALERREGTADRAPAELDGSVTRDICWHLLRAGEGPRALRYLDAAMTHLEDAYRTVAAAELAELALSIAGLLTGDERVKLLLRAARDLDTLGERDREKACLEESMEIADAGSDARWRAEARLALGRHLHSVGSYALALSMLERCVEFADEAGDERLAARARGGIGTSLTRVGRLEEARDHLVRAVSEARRLEDAEGESVALGNLGSVLEQMGLYAEAQIQHQLHMAHARKAGLRRAEARASGNLGSVHFALGRFEEARTCYERYMELSHAMADMRGEAFAVGDLGSLHAFQGRFGRALEFHERSLALAREAGVVHPELIALSNLGTTLARLGDFAAARERLEDARRRAVETDTRALAAYCRSHLGDLARMEGDLEEAERAVGESVETLEELKVLSNLDEALIRHARVLLELERHDEAAARLDEAIELTAELTEPGSRVYALALRATLPGGDAAAALSELERHRDRVEHLARMESRYFLWQATGETEHLAEAHGLLRALCEGAPDRYQSSLVDKVPVHGAIAQEWSDLNEREPAP